MITEYLKHITYIIYIKYVIYIKYIIYKIYNIHNIYNFQNVLRNARPGILKEGRRRRNRRGHDRNYPRQSFQGEASFVGEILQFQNM